MPNKKRDNNEISSDSTEPKFDVGSRLRMIREQKKLSQRELARRVGVTNVAISLIEKNKNSPSVSLLKKVLDGMPISLSEFFALDLPSEDKVFFKEEELVELTKGAISFKQVGGNMEHSTLQILSESYQAGADTGKTMLGHEGEEGGVVLCGQLEVTVGNQTTVLTAGDAYHFDSRLPHRFRNIGKEECKVISACTPPYL